MGSTSINLIRNVAGSTTDASGILRQLRLIALISLAGFLTAGLVAVIFFVVLQRSLEEAVGEEKRLTNLLTELRRLEGLQTIVSSRLRILANISDFQPNIEEILATVSRLRPDAGVAGITLDDESGLVSVKLDPQTIADANTLVGVLVEMTLGREIIDGRLVSVALSEDGRLAMTVSFKLQ